MRNFFGKWPFLFNYKGCKNKKWIKFSDAKIKEIDDISKILKIIYGTDKKDDNVIGKAVYMLIYKRKKFVEEKENVEFNKNIFDEYYKQNMIFASGRYKFKKKYEPKIKLFSIIYF